MRVLVIRVKSTICSAFKGGVNCGHYWAEQLYSTQRKKQTESILKNLTRIKDYVEVDDIPKSYKGKPRGWKDAKKAPKDMPNNGHHPNYNK